MRREEINGTRFARVESVEVYELSDRDAIERLCPDGVVYDLSVEGNNNYFANGMLVHNCGAYPKPSKRYKDIRAMRYAYLLLMSGTPSPESYSQLYHQFALGRAPWPEYKNFYRWADRYVNVKEKYVGTGQKVNDYSDAKEALIMRDIAPLTVTVTQEQAGFTTEIEEITHLVEMKPRTYRIAQRIMRDGVVGSPRCRAVVADTGAKAMSKLHQVYSGTVITERHGAVAFDDSKVRYIVETFKGKTAILYKFQAEGDMLKAAFDGRWTDSPEVFNAVPHMVYIGQVQSSREGVNLSSADDLVFFSIDHSALSYLQGINRAAYLGRDRANRVHWVFAARSIEPKIYNVVKAKENYTTNHYRHDRIRLPIEADKAIRIRGLDGPEAGAGEQSGLPRSAAVKA